MKLKHILLGAALAAGMGMQAASAPKYIFYYIGDGMGISPLMAAQAYNREVLGSDSLLKMMQMPVASYAMTYSASAPITDSAAAGTASLYRYQDQKQHARHGTRLGGCDLSGRTAQGYGLWRGYHHIGGS